MDDDTTVRYRQAMFATSWCVPPPRKKGDITYLVRFGENIKAERNARQLTQEAMAEAVGLSVRGYQRIEAGDINPTVTTLARIQNTLGCQWTRLMPEEIRTSKG